MNGWAGWVSVLPFEWAQYGFMAHALLAVLLIAPVFALIGCMVINHQMAFYSEAVGHAALTGIALGVLLGLGDPLWSMLGFAVLLGLGVSVLRRYAAASPDTVISLVMAFSVALGVVLLSRGGNFARYSKYLVGDILTITPPDLLRLGVVLGGVLVLWLFFFSPLFLVSIHRTLARSRGWHVWSIEVLFTVVVALVVTVSIPWVGLLVINAMLILPAAAARNLARNTAQYVLGAVVLGVGSAVTGLIGSFYWGGASGATIVLVSMALFVVTLLARSVRRRG